MALAYLLNAYTAHTQCWPFCKLGTPVILLCELQQLHRLSEECCPACTASLFCSSASQRSYCFAYFSVCGCQSSLSRMCCAELRRCLIIMTDAHERGGMRLCRLMPPTGHHQVSSYSHKHQAMQLAICGKQNEPRSTPFQPTQ